ncbi:unnamed protein product [Chilo suppressalis]|uniref:Uncharacterized protein n=1 Tax=Chilo suppressalis TaxID=168631 RepID=A0ABN8B0H4_CHISP|nr:unnamed protein product [Chilo suppressalis]
MTSLGIPTEAPIHTILYTSAYSQKPVKATPKKPVFGCTKDITRIRAPEAIFKLE